MLRINDDTAMIHTVDFFAPVVDDPYDYGAIAAANSMSDVFAMGGTIVMGLNIAAFPDDLDYSILSEIFRGGSDKMQEAGGVIAGGHTVTDAEPKYGIAVTGMVHPGKIWTKAGAQPGDMLYLTKPLGTGVLTTAAKQGAIDYSILQPALHSMRTLNLDARAAAFGLPVSSATDITGFGLLGHAHEMAERSGVQLQLVASAMPVFPHVEELVRNGVVAGGLHRNQDHYSSDQAMVTIDTGITPERIAVGYDPQTSGGLLFSIPENTSAELEQSFTQHNVPFWNVGRVVEGRGVRLVNDTAI